MASFADLPAPVDLAIIAVPAAQVLGVVGDAADAGVPTAVVITSGFQELGDEGATLQRELAALARARSIRVVGPNCLGVMNNHPEIQLNATFTRVLPPDGGLAVATQSGGVGIVLADLARELDLGIGSLVSLGNKVDVSGNDLLAAWTDDTRVTAAAFYLESFGNARKFARIARRFAERKPLMAVVGGRSDGGRRAGASHTAAAATPAVGVAALFAQAGVISCDGAEDLAETALLLTREPLPAGKRLGIVSNAGGMGVLAADAAESCGLTVPELSERDPGEDRGTRPRHGGDLEPRGRRCGSHRRRAEGHRRRRPRLRRGRRPSGGAGRDQPDGPRCGHGGSGLRARATPAAADGARRPGAGRGASRHSRHDDLPIVGGGSARAGPVCGVRRLAGGAGTPTSTQTWHSRNRRPSGPCCVTARTRPGSCPPRRARTAGSAPSRPKACCRTSACSRWEGWPEASSAVVALARSVGFPVAIKVADGDVVHRTERGLVRVGLASPEAVINAVGSFERELGRTDVPVLVQPLVTGVELAVGVVRDSSVGPTRDGGVQEG